MRSQLFIRWMSFRQKNESLCSVPWLQAFLCSLSAPHLVYLWSIFAFVSEDSIGLLFMCWNEKIWWEKRFPHRKLSEPEIYILVFLLTARLQKTGANPSGDPGSWCEAWEQLLESGGKGEDVGWREEMASGNLHMLPARRMVLCD